MTVRRTASASVPDLRSGHRADTRAPGVFARTWFGVAVEWRAMGSVGWRYCGDERPSVRTSVLTYTLGLDGHAYAQ